MPTKRLDISEEKEQASLSKSLDELTNTINSNPKDASAFFNRGKIYHEQGQYDQAIEDYKKAVELEPKLKADIEAYIEHRLKFGDNFKKIPDAVLYQEASLLDAKDLNQLHQSNRRHAELFKPALALKKLLRLVVRYELDEKTIQEAIAAGVNPILHEVDALLTKDPSLALKRDHITDHSGRKFYWSPLEAAHWTRHWVLRNMIFNHAQDKRSAAEQIGELEAKAYNYDLLLISAEDDTFPLLKKIPALIKQSDKIFQWGEVNGEWQLTELEGESKEIFLHLNFPDSSIMKSITKTNNQITTEMYDALKIGHTLAHFDLKEYLRAVKAFLKKHPVDVEVPEEEMNDCNTDSFKIGKAQKKFPAWIAAIWFSKISFDPIPAYEEIISSPEIFRLHVDYLGINLETDFFNDRLGIDYVLCKSSFNQCMGIISWSDHVYMENPQNSCFMITHDLAAMENLQTLINEKFTLPLQEEPNSTPRISG